MNSSKRYLLLVLSLLILPGILIAQDRLFWDFPDPVEQAYGGRFPELMETASGLALIWQEFDGKPDELNATIAVRAMFTEDGSSWTQPVLSVAEGLSYQWLEEVPLFS